MELQQQTHNDCWPTSVCMLTGYSRNTLMDQIEWRFGEPWHLLWHSPRWRDLAKFVVETTGAPDSLLADLFDWSTRDHHDSRPSGVVGIGIPKTGRGILVIGNQTDTRRHAVAFEDGTVYDPFVSAPMTEEEFNLRYKDWQIVSITEDRRTP